VCRLRLYIHLYRAYPVFQQEAQLMPTNPRDAFIGQLARSPNIVPFHMLGFSSCAIVTLSLRRAVFPTFDFKNVVTLKSGSQVNQGHWKWYHVCVWFPISVICTIYRADVARVKTSPFVTFLNNSVRHQSILIRLGTQHPEERCCEDLLF